MPATAPFLSLTRRRFARPGTALAVALTAAALTSCSGDADPSSEAAGASSADTAQASQTQSSGSGAAEDSEATASPNLLRAIESEWAIELSETEVAAGDYTIEVANEGGAVHDLNIEDAAGNDVAATEVITPGGSSAVQVTLQPGEYVVYCSVDSHRGRGMELTVTVE